MLWVVGDHMFPLGDFQRGPLLKPRIEIQEMAVFKALEADYAPETQKSAIQSLTLDENCPWLRIMVCLQIANKEPNDWDWDQRKQEIINSPKHEPVGIYCTLNNWDEVKQSFKQVKECGWARATFLAQRAQMGHARRHL